MHLLFKCCGSKQFFSTYEQNSVIAGNISLDTERGWAPISPTGYVYTALYIRFRLRPTLPSPHPPLLSTQIFLTQVSNPSGPGSYDLHRGAELSQSQTVPQVWFCLNLGSQKQKVCLRYGCVPMVVRPGSSNCKPGLTVQCRSTSTGCETGVCRHGSHRAGFTMQYWYTHWGQLKTEGIEEGTQHLLGSGP